jgi:prepilin-type N-terminal cleavage/methylation domain-containing protein
MDQTINKHTTKNPPAPLRSASPFIKGDLENIPKRGIFAFTLVELIVVVTILAILATIGFVSYSSYLT